MESIFKRALSAVIFLLWLVVLFVMIAITGTISIPVIMPPVFALIFLAFVAFNGASKFSSFTGKVLIIIGLFATFSLLIERGLDIVNARGLVATLTLATGIYLERINPHQRLKTWMFLGIATKVQFMIITALISFGRSIDFENTIISLEAWWLVIPLMIIGIPLLILKQKLAYRVLVLLTSVFVVILFLNLIVAGSGEIGLILLAILAFCWPIVVERAIGVKTFYWY